MSLDIEHAMNAILGASMEGMADAMEHVLGVATDHVPHEYGDLQNSGKATTDKDSRMGAVSFDSPYAVRQHEELTWRHNAGRTAKYLENAVNSERDNVAKLIAGAARRKIGG